MWPLYGHENLHIEMKRIFISTYEYYEAHGCEHNLKLLLSRTNCAFPILPEMGTERKISELGTSTWPQEHGGQDFIWSTSQDSTQMDSWYKCNQSILPLTPVCKSSFTLQEPGTHNSHWSSWESSTMILPCFRSACGRWSVLGHSPPESLFWKNDPVPR